MLYLENFSKIPDTTLLNIWVHYDDYSAMVSAFTQLGFDASTPKIRRRVRKVLAKNDWLPRDRPPTTNDYSQIKEALREQWKHEDII